MGAVITVLGVVLACFGVAQLSNGRLWRMDEESSTREPEGTPGQATATVGD
jgi:hypothetical protein